MRPHRVTFAKAEEPMAILNASIHTGFALAVEDCRTHDWPLFLHSNRLSNHPLPSQSRAIPDAQLPCTNRYEFHETATCLCRPSRIFGLGGRKPEISKTN